MSDYETTQKAMEIELSVKEEAEQEGVTALEIKHRRFAACLVEGMTAEDASLKIGVGISTGYRYLNDPEVKQLYKEWKEEITNRMVRKLQRHGDDAITVAAAIMNDEEVSAQTRLQAAFGIMDRLGVRADAKHGSEEARVSVVIERSYTVVNNNAAEAQARRALGNGVREVDLEGEYRELVEKAGQEGEA